MTRYVDFFQAAAEQTRRVCICHACYSTTTPLVFPASEQEIILISESPYKFPEKSSSTIEDFVNNHLFPRIWTYSSQLPERSVYEPPRDIFDFILRTFKPLFSQPSTKEDVVRFLSVVYWTHAAKKTPRLAGGVLRDAYLLCQSRLHQELLQLHPELLIVASSKALRSVFGEKTAFRDSFELQRKALNRGVLLHIADFRLKEADFASDLSDCEILVFPNPSGIAESWKKWAYSQPETRTGLRILHRRLESLSSRHPLYRL